MKLFRALAQLNLIVVGLLFAWICFTGSARTTGMILIVELSIIFLIDELTKKEE